MTKPRKYRIEIVKDEELDTRFRISLLPFRYRKAPATMWELAFVSKRTFDSEGDAILQARATFGNIFTWKRNQAGQLQSSFSF